MRLDADFLNNMFNAQTNEKELGNLMAIYATLDEKQKSHLTWFYGEDYNYSFFGLKWNLLDMFLWSDIFEEDPDWYDYHDADEPQPGKFDTIDFQQWPNIVRFTDNEGHIIATDWTPNPELQEYFQKKVDEWNKIIDSVI